MKKNKFSLFISIFIPAFLIFLLVILAIIIVYSLIQSISFSKTLIFGVSIATVCVLLLFSLWFYQRHYTSTSEKDLENAVIEKDKIIKATMKTFVNFLDNKDTYTRGHSIKVARFSREIAKRLGFDEKTQANYYYAGLMHDIGKITISDDILLKPTKLSSEEWEIIRDHTRRGAELLKDFKYIPEVNDAVLYHHERYDGDGYVNMLKGEAIPLVARVVCIADCYDAMSRDRIYRIRFSEERIITEFERCSGRQFDPKLVPIIIAMIKDGTVYKI